MVSVVFAIWPFPHATCLLGQSPPPATPRRARPPAPRLLAHPAGNFEQQATCQFGKPLPRFGSDIAWPQGAGVEVNDVNDLPSLSEPHGPDGAVAVGGGKRAEISQFGAPGHLGPAVRPAGRRARTDLALGADL